MQQHEDIQKKLQKKRRTELLRYFREIVGKDGFGAAVRRTLRYIKRRYGSKRGRFLPKKAVLEYQRRADETGMPRISVCVPVYNPGRPFLEELIASVVNQTYSNWELCLADAGEDNTVLDMLLQKYNDDRIKVTRLENKGISGNTNEAVKLAEGHYIAFADHDDVLSPNALYEVAKTILRTGAEFVYSDEALFERDILHPSVGHFKPDYSPEYLLNCNYIGHMVVVKRGLFLEQGGLDSRFDGSQDYDFNLRALEKAEGVVHIQKVLYYWRQHAQSTSVGVEAKPYVQKAAQNAITAHLERIGVRGTVVDGLFPSTYKVNYALNGTPTISIIIPSCDHVDDLRRCIDSIYNKSYYKQFEVIVVENNSQRVETFNYYRELAGHRDNARVLVYEDTEFNFSRLCNFGAEGARGSYLLFLNNDTEVISPMWLEEMLMLCQLPGVGVVGPMLYYPDDTVQHAGVIVGLGGFAGHSHKYAMRGRSGYMFRQACVQELSAVTGACMMVKAEAFDALHGFDAGFKVAYNDVDLCLRARGQGYSVLFTPYAELYHYESKSRGDDEKGEKARRFAAEQARLLERYGTGLLHDPFYNPNLTQDREDFTENDVLPEA